MVGIALIVVNKIVDNITRGQYRPRMARPLEARGWSEPAGATSLTQSLSEQIAAELSRRIASSVYGPGQRVLEQAVAAEFAVSRGPVREALRLLEKEGLVTILPRRGAQVTNLSVDEVREIFDIRAVLNGLRDRQLADHPARLNFLPVIEAEVGKLARLVREAGDGARYVETVFELNRLLNEATPNKRLSSILGSLALQTLRYSRLGLSTPERRRQSLKHWQQLVRAIREGDGEAAQQAAERRVRDSRDAAIKLLEKP
jgi:DNA-binding GntR family transcriptional regulator